jgi:hypothetical protein
MSCPSSYLFAHSSALLSGLPHNKFDMDTYLQPATPGEALLVQQNQVLFHEDQA